MFRDRKDAGQQLARALVHYKDQPVVVFALPRGGVPLGVEIARFLNAPLDLIVVRKIGHPLQPEYAIGAVAEDGYVVWGTDEIGNLDDRWRHEAAMAEKQEAQRRRTLFTSDRAPVPIRDKTAIIVDDGLATGLTMRAAIHEVRERGPQKLVVAVPVAAVETAQKIRPEVDELVVLHLPEWFGAVGAFYEHFEQLTDDEVIAMLNYHSR
jgi:predicted phosphoribosyltransferase